ncbi:MAG: type II secretion system major pseudopilin GspG [Planctomycetes bacterium]|nr:type II secretion system major pseudopilin GspG [Planctomycetota bacterium]
MLTFNTDHRPRPMHGQVRSAFTLMEVLLVLVILVVLGAIVVPMFTGIGESANVKAATVQVNLLADAINYYKMDVKQFPSSLEDLVNEPSDAKLAKKWSGPYMEANKNLADPWDNPYKYDAKGKKNQGSYDVWSVGPDGQDGTEDDIGNWQNKS